MAFFRKFLGVWLLKPTLVSELRHAVEQQGAHPERERYWMGRITGVRRILDRD